MLKQRKCGKTKPVSFLTSQHFFTLLLVEVYMLVIIKIGYQIFFFLISFRICSNSTKKAQRICSKN
jgi:hypothetical protein